MPNEFEIAAAKLLPKYSEAAKLRRDEITNELREISLESFRLRIDELRRLIDEGQPYQETLASARVVQQRMETENLRDPMAVALLGFMLDAGKNGQARRYFQPHVQSRMKELGEQSMALAIEDLEISERELRRIGLETGGYEGAEYAQAACLIEAMRKELAAGDDAQNPGGVLGMMMGLVEQSAAESAKFESRVN